jgi:hypothetical protein
MVVLGIAELNEASRGSLLSVLGVPILLIIIVIVIRQLLEDASALSPGLWSRRVIVIIIT